MYYFLVSSRQPASLTPLIVGLISSLANTAAEHSNEGEPLRRTLRMLHDGATNIAPLSEPPAHVSQAARHGILMATMWQSVGSIHHRYGDAADDILPNGCDGAVPAPAHGLSGYRENAPFPFISFTSVAHRHRV